MLGRTDGKADYSVPDTSGEFAIHITRVAIPIKNTIHAGWLSLGSSKETTEQDLLVRADAPGFVQWDGKISSQRLVQPRGAWQAGDLIFSYRVEQRDTIGKNILEERAGS